MGCLKRAGVTGQAAEQAHVPGDFRFIGWRVQAALPGEASPRPPLIHKTCR
jgi:hypothetical protein